MCIIKCVYKNKETKISLIQSSKRKTNILNYFVIFTSLKFLAAAFAFEPPV